MLDLWLTIVCCGWMLFTVAMFSKSTLLYLGVLNFLQLSRYLSGILSLIKEMWIFTSLLTLHRVNNLQLLLTFLTCLVGEWLMILPISIILQQLCIRILCGMIITYFNFFMHPEGSFLGRKWFFLESKANKIEKVQCVYTEITVWYLVNELLFQTSFHIWKK